MLNIWSNSHLNWSPLKKLKLCALHMFLTIEGIIRWVLWSFLNLLSWVAIVNNRNVFWILTAIGQRGSNVPLLIPPPWAVSTLWPSKWSLDPNFSRFHSFWPTVVHYPYFHFLPKILAGLWWSVWWVGISFAIISCGVLTFIFLFLFTSFGNWFNIE